MSPTIIVAESGNDRISAGFGTYIIYALRANPPIHLDSADAIVYAGHGDDEISIGGTHGSYQLYAGNGNNVITGSLVLSDAQIITGNGNDTIDITGAFRGSGPLTIYAGGGHNTIHAAADQNEIHTGPGDDQIHASGMYSTVSSIGGNNTIQLMGNGATLHTGAGDDRITAYLTGRFPGTQNLLHLGDGNNTLTGHLSVGDYRLIAGGGDDQMNITGGSAKLEVLAGDGNNTVSISFKGDTFTLVTGAGEDTIQAIDSTSGIFYVGEGNNTVSAGFGDDVISAGAGNDTLAGGTGVNTILAGEGENTIISTGTDSIYTGSDRDLFQLSAGEGVATIHTFDSNDRIHLGSDASFADLSVSQVGNDTFLSITTTNDLLAVLKNVQANSINSQIFV
ncbi:hypothetical protein C7B76_01775 [filamentous cyanobacterium CCP2]|nr:hypothetical protein C7B76_01775 [filamentous cyanobacterium CCP2]